MVTETTARSRSRGRGVFAALALLALAMPVPAEAQSWGGFGRAPGYGSPFAARAPVHGGRGPGAYRPPYPGPRPYPSPGTSNRPPRGTGPVAQRDPRYPYPRPRPPRTQTGQNGYPAPRWPAPVWRRPGMPVAVPPVAIRPAYRPPPPPPSVAPPAQAAGRPSFPNPPRGTLPPPPAPPASPGAAEPSFVAGEVLFRPAGSQTVAAVDQAARQYGLTRVDVQAVPLLGQTIYRYRLAGRTSVEAAVRLLGADPRFAAVQPNFLFRLTDGAPPGMLAQAQYAVLKLHLAEAHRLARGEGVLVAVIDSGVDGDHPELAGTIGASLNALSSALAPHPHGTGIAGVIAAHGQLLGVAPGARLVPVRAFETGAGSAAPTGTTFGLLRAVSMAAEAGARVVNMSFAGPRDPLFGQVVAAGTGRGMVFVAAAGNGGPTAPPAYPAAEPGVIAVTATDAADRLFPAANRGAYIGLAAPGVDVLVAAPGSAYGFSSGTSVAAAHVSGIVALLLQRHPGLTPEEVRRQLTAGVTPIGQVGGDPDFGAGLVDAARTLEATPLALVAGAGQPGAAAFQGEATIARTNGR